MDARLSNNLQSIERDIKELSDEKSVTILSLREKLIHEVHEYDLDEKKLQQQLRLCEEKIEDAEQRQLECEDYPLFDKDEDDLVKDISETDISKSVILYDEKLAEKCRLSPEEKMSWAVRSNAYYGSFLNPVSYVRSFSVWSGADRFIRQTPVIGEYLAGPSSVSPVSVMLKLKQIFMDSTRKKIANQDFLNAIQDKEKITKDLDNCRAFRQANQLEIQRIQAFNDRIVAYDLIMSSTINLSQDPFTYLAGLLGAKKEIDRINYTKHQGFEPFIQERADKLNAEIDGAIHIIINQYDHVANTEERYNKLKKSRKALYELGVKVPDELYIKIQNLRLQKAWDTTYEVHKFGDQEREFKHYFLGVPQYLGYKGHFAVACFLYTVGFGFLFTPIKNTLKLFTEALPKKMDAYCENRLERLNISELSSDLALVGHYFFKAWWLCLRPITSPIVSVKAAWHSSDNIENKYVAWTARLALSALSLALSFATLLAVIVVVPKVVLGLLGEAGGVVAAAATTADSVILPVVPVTYANVAATIRGAVDVGFDRCSSARVAARIPLNKINKSDTFSGAAISTVPHKHLDDMASHYINLPESKTSAGPINIKRKL